MEYCMKYVLRTQRKGNFAEVCRPLHKRIGRYLLKYNIHLAEGQRFEVPIAMEEYIKEIAKWFQRGVCITVDYGYTKKNGCILHIKKEFTRILRA